MESASRTDSTWSREVESAFAPDSSWSTLLEQEMQSASTWSRLPDDVLQQVLARLPLPDLLRARTVCQHWAALISTATFLHTSHPYFPVTIQGGNNLLLGYDHGTNAWQKLPPLDFIPGEEPALPVAAAAGLICLQTPAIRYLLCNPVARTYLTLPEIAPKWTPLSAVHILPDQNSYCVLIIGKVNSHHYVAVYSSATGVWDFRDADRAVAYGRTSVVCGGVLYCGAFRGSECVIGYDINADVWQEGTYRIPPQPDYQLTQMVECGGEVYMALARGYGGVGASGVVSSFSILKLETTAGANVVEVDTYFWREVSFLGDEMLGDLQEAWLSDDDSGAIVCVGYGSRLCVAAGLAFVLVFDVGNGCWNRLPVCPEVGGDASVVADPFHFAVELRLASLV